MNKIKNNWFFWLLIFFFSFLLTAYFTWPFPKYLFSYYSDYGDHTATGWILWNNYKHFFDNHAGRYISNQLYPYPYVDIFFLNTLVPGLFIFSPLFFISKNFFFSVNTTIFIALVLTFFSAFLVFYYLVKNRTAAIVGAIVFSFCPLVMSRFIDHAVLLYRFFIPPLFLFFYYYLKQPKLKWSFLFFLFFTLNGLTNPYFLTSSLFFLIIIFFIKIISLKKFVDIIIFLKKLILTSWVFIIFLPLLFFYYQPYFQASSKEQLERSLMENAYFSAEVTDFFLGLPANKFFGQWYKNKVLDQNYAEHSLFFGFLANAVLITGLFFLVTNKIKKNKKLIFGAYCLIIIAVILSLGPFFKVNFAINPYIKLPYYYFYQSLPFIKGMRVPSRIMLVAIFFAVFIIVWFIKEILETDVLFKSPKKQSVRFFKILFSLIIIIFLLLEYKNNYSFSFYQTPSLNHSFLSHKKVLFLPDLIEKSYAYNAKYINLAILNDFTVVNGYSAYYPSDYIDLILYLNKNRFQKEWFEVLKSLKIDYVIFDKSWYQKFFGSGLKTDLPNNYFYLKVFENRDWLILDLNRYPDHQCYFDGQLSKLKIEIVTNEIYQKNQPLIIEFRLTNPTNCPLRFFYDQRYLKTNFLISETLIDKVVFKKNTYLPVAPVILPKKTIFIRKNLIDNLVLPPDIYSINIKVGEKNFNNSLIIR
ncbi:MAG: hypothetical protein QHH09_00990 [Microgenomates group bacterium]|nr:hypothetical protein [Microgenomates group bacterium]